MTSRWCASCGDYKPHHEHAATLFDMVGTQVDTLVGSGQARTVDPETSKEAARLVTARATSARVCLLKAHYYSATALTDEEAASLAGLSLSSEYATRCSELERMGMLQNTGDTRTGRAGAQRMARRITPEGRAVIAARGEA